MMCGDFSMEGLFQRGNLNHACPELRHIYFKGLTSASLLDEVADAIINQGDDSGLRVPARLERLVVQPKWRVERLR